MIAFNQTPTPEAISYGKIVCDIECTERFPRFLYNACMDLCEERIWCEEETKGEWVCYDRGKR